ncbi:MAG: hypothetical protein JXA54_00560 [Candidatus Heimdallarchaeota archaeon]|nr:hypothetical protein [Candidatus Heimdallarchaeota archaeon]
MTDERAPKSKNEHEAQLTDDKNKKESTISEKILIQAQEIIEYIKSQNNILSSDELINEINKIIDLSNKNDNFLELFYMVIEAIIEAAKHFDDTWDIIFISSILDKLFTFLDEYLELVDYLTAISQAILDVLEILMKFEFYDELEDKVILLVNKSITNQSNLILKTLASEAIIITIKCFGEDWNYEKTKEFDIILKGLLPPKEIDEYLSSILIKGLAIEIDCYGDMQEFSSMKRTLNLMKELFIEKLTHSEEFLIHYANGLVNAVNWFGEAEEYEEMVDVLDELTSLSDAYSAIIELKINLADGLRIALDHCGIMEDLDSATRLAKRLLQLAEELPYNKKIQSLVIMGVFKAAIWAGTFWETGIINSLLSEISKIIDRFPDDLQLKLLLGRGLFNLTKELSLNNNTKLMNKIVNELKGLYNKNLEIIEIVQFYSQSLVNMLHMLGEYSDNFQEIFEHIAEAQILAERYFEDDIVIISYSKSLVNVIRALGLQGKIVEMEEYLDLLIDFETTSENNEVTIRLGKAFIDVIKVYGDINDLDKITQIYMVMKDWIMNDLYNVDYQILLAKALVNIISGFGKNQKINEMNLYLDELRTIAITYASYSVIQTQLAKGLTHTIRSYVNMSDLMRCIPLLYELRSISANLPDDLEIQETLGRSTRRILVLAHNQNNYELFEELLESLRKLLKQYNQNETIQLEMARALTSIIIEESAKEKSPFWQSLVMELKGLTIQYSNNSKLIAIHQTIAPLLSE